jgi:hypothetical protein
LEEMDEEVMAAEEELEKLDGEEEGEGWVEG